MNNRPDCKARKLRTWCRENEIGVTKAYELIKTGQLKVVKIGTGTYVLESESDRFFQSLLQEAA